MKSSKTIVEEYLKKKDWRVNDSSSCPFSIGALNKYVDAEVCKDYWLREVYTEDIAQAYVDGHMHIHDLGGLTLYTYFGKETVIIKTPDNKILCTSFQLLYDSLIEKERCVNTKDDVWQIDVSGYRVLDKDGWTNIQKLTKKRKHRNMVFIKNEQGRSVIVTDNHPMLIKENNSGDVIEKAGSTVKKETDYLYSADLKKLLKDEHILYKKNIDLLKEMPSKIGRNLIYADSYPIDDVRDNNSINIIHTTKSSLPRYLCLTQELGFAIGFILAEGSFTRDSTVGAISIKNKNKNDVDRVVNALMKINCYCTINMDENNFYNVYIANELFSYLLRVIMNIRPYSLQKNLPENILEYNIDFINGIISGVIDGDGNGSQTQVTIRVASRTMLEQIATCLPFLGLFGRDRDIEGQGTVHYCNGRELHQNYPLYGIAFRKQNEVLNSKKYQNVSMSKSHWRTEELDTWSKILNVEDVCIPDDYIYDITTESHTLLVNGMYNHNCCGYSLRDILMKGVRGVPNIPSSRPAKHFDSVLNQIANLITIFQNEIMGAVALNSFDTLLAPFIKMDKLSYAQVKQSMQNYIFSVNSNSRAGAEPAFSNITFDLTPPKDLLNEYCIIGGDLVSFTYKSCQQEMDMLNRAFFEVMYEGDADGKLFSYPIPTYNIHERFDWDNPNNKMLWEMTGKYGTPYFANFLNSDLDISDVRSMCCRLRINLKELRKRNGGLFGAGDSTGSIGVVTINLPRIAYETKGDKDAFYAELDKYLNLAKKSLVMKRAWLQENIMDTKAIPAFIEYVGTLKNHFSTIGIIGENEMCENFLGVNILDENGKKFALEVGNHIRSKLLEFQEECGCLFNFEATPAESTCYSLALKDKKVYPDIITQGSGNDCYYTNSCHIPVSLTTSINDTFKHQEDLQAQFTGGTVIHCYLEGAITGEQAKAIVKAMCTTYKVPYMSLSPISRYCDEHGYIKEIVDKCPICKKKLKMYQRITGYLRCVDNFNKGKKAEFNDRKQYTTSKLFDGIVGDVSL